MAKIEYKYGVSFNCLVNGQREVGGGGEGDATLDMVGNDLDKIEEALIVDGKDQGFNYIALREGHDCIGHYTNVGNGCVVAVVGEDMSDMSEVDEDNPFYVVCVIFEDPTFPEVIE